MADLRKVIRGLECCTVRKHPCGDCVYFVANQNDEETGWCERDKIVRDAIELLKEQEPVKAYRLHGEKVIDNSEKVFTGQCANCFCYLVDGWKACPVCGKAVKWDD